MTKRHQYAERAGCSVYEYISYTGYPVLCFMVILFFVCWLSPQTGSLHASQREGIVVMPMCSVTDIDDELEVRDAEGRIVENDAAKKKLEALFISCLTQLLFESDIHSIVMSRIRIERTIVLGRMMFAMPAGLLQCIRIDMLLPILKTILLVIFLSHAIPVPGIIILVFPGMFLMLHARKLSTVFLRL